MPQPEPRSAAGPTLARQPAKRAPAPLRLWPALPRSVVLDAEAVAYDREEGKVLPFQVRAEWAGHVT